MVLTFIFLCRSLNKRQERHKQEEERREKIKKYREILEKQRDSIRVSGKLQHPHSIEDYDTKMMTKIFTITPILMT